MKERYTSVRWLEAEQARLWPRVWHLDDGGDEGAGLRWSSDDPARPLADWLGPLDEHGEGRVRFLAAEYDTTRVTLEVFPAQPHLTRLLLVCAPLERQAVGRSGRGPALRRPRWEEAATCRPLPP